MKLAGNTILITGGSSGIGLELVKEFYKEGNIIIVAARNKQKLDELQVEFPGLVAVQSDLSRQTDLDKLVLLIEQEYPRLNILVNNAAIQYNYQFTEEANLVNKIDFEILVNLVAPIKLSGLLLPILLRNQNAAIVNVSSGLAISPKKSAPVYCATKAAIHQFSKALRYQLEGTGVKLFEIIPPLVDTPMTEGRGKDKLSPEALVSEFLYNFKHNKVESYIGKSKLLKFINRLSPALSDRILKDS